MGLVRAHASATRGLSAERASFASLNRRATSYRTKQARRFKELANYVGADELPEGLPTPSASSPPPDRSVASRSRGALEAVHLMERG